VFLYFAVTKRIMSLEFFAVADYRGKQVKGDWKDYQENAATFFERLV